MKKANWKYIYILLKNNKTTGVPFVISKDIPRDGFEAFGRIRRTVPSVLLPSFWGRLGTLRLGPLPQAHHHHGDGRSDVGRRRRSAPVARPGCERGPPRHGPCLHVGGADVCGAGPGVDPHPEAEAETACLLLRGSHPVRLWAMRGQGRTDGDVKPEPTPSSLPWQSVLVFFSFFF